MSGTLNLKLFTKARKSSNGSDSLVHVLFGAGLNNAELTRRVKKKLYRLASNSINVNKVS